MILYVIQKIVGNKNYPDSINIMVNHHYHGEKGKKIPRTPVNGVNNKTVFSLHDRFVLFISNPYN